MGEKIKAAKSEFGEAEKKREALKLSAFLPVLNRAVSVHLSPSRNIQDQGGNMSMHRVRD